jgi:hypothetical protein
MRQALGLFVVIGAGLFWADLWLGYEAAYEIGYGALTLMAAMIAATFLWLWHVRATPLALGMAFSWAGAASVMGWWWVYTLSGGPDWMLEGEMLFVFLSLYFVGAILHFAVVGRSLGLPAGYLGFPVATALVLSAIIHAVS